MGKSNLIPQAYTARDVADAYKWLQTLPQPVRDEMKTAEQMVLNYLKAKTLGQLANYQFQESQKESQKKSQEFHKTLQTLKTEMDQFDTQINVPTQQQQTVHQQQPAQSQPMPQPQVPPQTLKMDPKSRQIINDIREGLNLSTDMEVIRMSLVLAHKAVKNLLE